MVRFSPPSIAVHLPLPFRLAAGMTWNLHLADLVQRSAASRPPLVLATRLLLLWLGVTLTASAAPRTLNILESFADTKAVLASGGEADILVLGDSLSFRQGSYLYPLRALLQRDYGDAGTGYQGFSQGIGGIFGDGWLPSRLSTDPPPHRSLDGLWNESSSGPGQGGAATSALFRATDPIIELHYVRQPGGGSLRIVDERTGQFLTTIDTSGSVPGVQAWDYQSTSEDNPRLTLQPQGDGLVTVLGQVNRSGLPGVRLHRASNGGWGVEEFLRRDTSFEDQLQLVDPDLVLVWLGQNDLAFDQAEYEVSMGQLADRLTAAVPAAEIVLLGTYDSGHPAIPGLVEAVHQVAADRSLGFINLFETAGDRLFFDERGFLDDGVHFSEAGGNHIADLLYRGWLTDGASLDPVAVADFDGNGLVDAGDIDLLAAEVRSLAPRADWDLDGSLSTDAADVDYLIHLLLRSRVGDADLDQRVLASTDGAAFLSQIGQPAGWAGGDFDGDGLVSASRDGSLLIESLGTGDLDEDGSQGVADIDLLQLQIRAGSRDPRFDLDGSGEVDADDLAYLLSELFQVPPGDTDLDRRVTASTDGGVLLTGLGGGVQASWATGDFDGDSLITASRDGSVLLQQLGSLTMASGDLNQDGRIDAADIDLLAEELRHGTPSLNFDLNASGDVTHEDRLFLIESLLGLSVGDTNLDGIVTASGDAPGLLDGLLGFALPGWAQGDFDGDGVVTASGDGQLFLVNLGAARDTAEVTVPEPRTLGLLVAGLLLSWLLCRFRRAR